MSQDNTAKAAPQSAAQQPMTTGKEKLPLVVLGLSNKIDPKKVRKEFLNTGLDILLAKDAAEFLEQIRNPYCFVVYIDLDFDRTVNTTLKDSISSTKAMWIVISKKLTTNQSSSIFNLGAVDLLTYPAHPVLMKNRARMILTRFLKTRDLPDDVVLPAGVINPRKPAKAQSPSFVSEEAQIIKIGGEKRPRGHGIEVVKGEKLDLGSSQIIRGDADQSKSSHEHQNSDGSHERQFLNANSSHDEAFQRQSNRATDADSGAQQTRIQGAPQGRIQRHHFASNEFQEYFATIKDKLIELKSGVAFNENMFPADALPKVSAPIDVAGHGYANCVADLRRLFREVSVVLEADRISLFALRGEHNGVLRAPPDLVNIASSDALGISTEILSSHFFPHVQQAVQNENAVFLNEQLPDTEQNRPKDWLIRGRKEGSSAIFPVSDGTKIIGVLILQFAKPVREEMIKVLEEAVTFLSIPKTHYVHLDFMKRVYSGLKKS